jgi:hypothetical protein
MLQVTDTSKHLHDMVQKYSSDEISREPVLLGLNTNQERNYETITLSLNMYIFVNMGDFLVTKDI